MKHKYLPLKTEDMNPEQTIYILRTFDRYEHLYKAILQDKAKKILILISQGYNVESARKKMGIGIVEDILKKLDESRQILMYNSKLTTNDIAAINETYKISKPKFIFGFSRLYFHFKNSFRIQ